MPYCLIAKKILGSFEALDFEKATSGAGAVDVDGDDSIVRYVAVEHGGLAETAASVGLEVYAAEESSVARKVHSAVSLALCQVSDCEVVEASRFYADLCYVFL